jgi:hypothetical protein
MKAFTKDVNGKHCGLFDHLPLCADSSDPHFVAAAQPKPKRKPSVSGVPRISLTVYTPSSLRKRSVMREKSLQQHTWRFRNQHKVKDTPHHTGKVIAYTTPCLKECIRINHSLSPKEREGVLDGFADAGCRWCEEFSQTLPLYGQPFHRNAEQSAKLCAMAPPSCTGARRLLKALSEASQLSDGACVLCAILLKACHP